MNELQAFHLAVEAARLSPCSKSKRGVVLWNRRSGRYVSACNAPPPGFVCDGSDSCRGACGKVAVHAEQTALLKAAQEGFNPVGKEMLHVKVFVAEAVGSGGPSCVDCSKLILRAGIKKVWLYEPILYLPRLVDYDPVSFHALSLEAKGLPVILADDQ